MHQVLSVFAVPSVTAQAGYKPSVPQFTVKLVDDSYDVPPSTTTVTDPYTGKESIVNDPGYHISDRTIECSIKNQPFTLYEKENAYTPPALYYKIQFKGHFEEKWDTFRGLILTAKLFRQILNTLLYPVSRA
ncbi:MAG: hypothetical protein LBB87_00480 [Nitrososphaerota archaeon]|nr:hypothetical protein [Nitrososphaerota archaeon]